MSRPDVTRVMAFPRDRNPYQDLLYGGLAGAGIEAVYIGELTSSQTLNIALLPFEVVARRFRGDKLLHIHWIFGFVLPVIGGLQAARRLSQCWFRLFLFTARCCGVKVIWTVHNVLPHERVFFDDVAARRRLVRACALVIAHSDAVLAEVVRLFGPPRAAIIMPIGPYVISSKQPKADRQIGDDRLHVVFVGKITRYKGIDDLLLAFADDNVRRSARLTVAGVCDDAQLEDELRAQAQRSGASTRFGYLPDVDLQRLLADADLVALPLRKASTSSTAVLALTAGVPVALPHDAALQSLPAAAVVRYDGTPAGLAAAIIATARLSPADRAAMGHEALTWADNLPSWRDIGDELAVAMFALIGDIRSSSPTTRSVSSPARGSAQ